MFSTRISLHDNARKASINLLQARLVDAADLASQAKQAHWNVKGPNFRTYHELFDATAATVTDYVDLIAERIVTLGGQADGTVRAAAQGSSLPEYPSGISDGLDHVAAIADQLAAFGKAIRQNIDDAAQAGDQATSDLFTEVTRGTDKAMWLVEAHLQTAR
jgi:starvation-inducible DNA-binding protein